jgi:hypothetical protein
MGFGEGLALSAIVAATVTPAAGGKPSERPLLDRLPRRHISVGLGVPKSVPRLGPRTVKRQRTPTNESIKNGPEIVNFRPVL